MARRPSVVDLQPKPRNDAYTVLLTISLVAMVAACLLLYYDIKSYPTLKPAYTAVQPQPTQTPPPIPGAGAPAQPTPPAPAPGTPMPPAATPPKTTP